MTIQELSEKLRLRLCPDGQPFSVSVSGHYDTYGKNTRWSLKFNGAFSRKDLNDIDEVFKEADVFYIIGAGEGILATLDLPYSEGMPGEML